MSKLRNSLLGLALSLSLFGCSDCGNKNKKPANSCPYTILHLNANDEVIYGEKASGVDSFRGSFRFYPCNSGNDSSEYTELPFQGHSIKFKQ
jgi:hypothetical protein